MVIAGPGLDSAYGKKMQQLVLESPQLRDAVFFPGMLAGYAKWGAFYSSEAFILPSHQENFGIAVVEAMACGKAVLISNKVNIWREIIDAGAGMVEDDTLQGIESLLSKWLNLSNNEKTIMADKTIKAYKKSFSIVPASLKFYEMLIS